MENWCPLKNLQVLALFLVRCITGIIFIHIYKYRYTEQLQNTRAMYHQKLLLLRDALLRVLLLVTPPRSYYEFVFERLSTSGRKLKT